jgi:hypothetical protein
MTNTMIVSAPDAESIRERSKGLGDGGGQVNTVNGDFVFEVSEAI